MDFFFLPKNKAIEMMDFREPLQNERLKGYGHCFKIRNFVSDV